MPSSVPPVIVVGGGQSGLAAARALRELQMPTVILEASDRPTGSWPRYYDSLRVFSPAGYSSMPGMPFPGAPDHYPGRDEVTDYLERYAARLDVEIRTNTRVETIRQDGKGFLVLTEDGRSTARIGHRGRERVVLEPLSPELPRRGYLHRRALARRRLPQPGAVRGPAGGRRRCGRLRSAGRQRTRAGRDGHDRHPPSRAVHPPTAARPGRPLLASARPGSTPCRPCG